MGESAMMLISRRAANAVLLGLSGGALSVGTAAWLAGRTDWATGLWYIGTLPVLVVLAISILRGLLHREAGLDLVALLSMGGALVMGEALTATVIALMVATGRVLEDWAQARAQREMTALLNRVPRYANRYERGVLVQVALEELAPGDRLLVRSGDAVPVDGLVAEGSAILDESMLTGESMPVSRGPGAAVRSGCINAANPFDMLATASAAGSSFASIVRLVDAARQAKSPSSRLADRYALLFVPLTLAIAGIAWLASGDPMRALAVLVVATPCPLILGVPVAIVSGMSRCAKRGVLIKGGAVLETLAQARTLFFDKTGTLTGGRARLVASEVAPAFSVGEVLRLAASMDQASPHVIAQAVVEAARSRALDLAVPTQVVETPGAGLCGVVDGYHVALGSLAYAGSFVPIPGWARAVLDSVEHDGVAAVFVVVDSELAGVLLLADEIRPETPRALRLLRKAGLQRLVMVSGDRRETAEAVGALLAVDAVLAEQTPADKLEALKAADVQGPVVMVGDGVNDAPALAAADVGVAMGARGSPASAETAGVVLLVDRLDRLAEGIAIARRARGIALQCVVAGMSLSLLAMLVAAFGYLPPLAGAILQEVIDVAVIANALRALRGVPPRGGRRGLSRADVERLRAEHAALEPVADRVRMIADRLSVQPAGSLIGELAELNTMLRDHLLAHEQRDEVELYPRVAEMLGGDDAMAPLSGMHREILRLCRRVNRAVAALQAQDAAAVDAADPTADLRRALYGLDTVLRLHFAEEEAVYHNLEEGS